MGEYYMKKEIFIIMLYIAISELMMMFGDIFYGMVVHTASLLAIIFLIIFGKSDIKTKYVLQSLILLILLRMVSISMPQIFANILLQYSLIYGVMFIPIYLIIKGQNISAKELGLNFKNMHIYFPLAIIIGIMTGFVEYSIINPVSLIERVRFSDIVLMSIVMFIFVGAVEEVIFRSILQTRLQKVLGMEHGILVSGVIFGIMHAGYGLIDEIIFTGYLGIVIGYIFHKSKSVPFVISIHAVTNIILFGFQPIYMVGVI